MKLNATLDTVVLYLKCGDAVTYTQWTGQTNNQPSLFLPLHNME